MIQLIPRRILEGNRGACFQSVAGRAHLLGWEFFLTELLDELFISYSITKLLGDMDAVLAVVLFFGSFLFAYFIWKKNSSLIRRLWAKRSIAISSKNLLWTNPPKEICHLKAWSSRRLVEDDLKDDPPNPTADGLAKPKT